MSPSRKRNANYPQTIEPQYEQSPQASNTRSAMQECNQRNNSTIVPGRNPQQRQTVNRLSLRTHPYNTTL